MGHLILGIDPGLSIGLGLIRVEDMKIVREARMTVQWETPFIEFLRDFKYVQDGEDFTVVVEEFQLLEHKASSVARNRGSRQMEASQVIGAVKYWAATGGYKMVMQSPRLNPTNALHSGLKIPKDHSKSHDVIAYNHAHHYALTNDLIKHRLIAD